MKSWSVRELIIEVQQQVQRLGSHRRDGLALPNIVWRLNTAQDLFVSNRIKPDPGNPNRFQIDEKYRADLQTIIKPNVKLTCYQDTSTRQFSYLPADFAFLLNDRSIVLEDCKTEFTTPTEDAVYSTYSFTFIESPLPTAPFYRNFSFVINGGASVETTTLAGLPSKEEKFELDDYILSKLIDLGTRTSPIFQAYWERFDTIYAPNSFIVVGLVGIPPLDLQIDGQTVAKAIKTLTLKKLKPYTSGPEVSNRGVRQDFLYDAINNNYYDRPTPHSPISTIADGKLFVASSKRFLVPEINIDYIRKPRRISLYLDQTCELPGSTHREVCGLAAELILGNVEAANYPAKVQENISRSE